MAYFILIAIYISPENQPVNNADFETTPINLKMKGVGERLVSNQEALFQIIVYKDEYVTDSPTGIPLFEQTYFELKPEFEDIYREIGIKTEPQNTVVVIPMFTISAYGEPGFYTYYRGKCDSRCINSVPIRYELSPTYESSVNTIRALDLLGYQFLTDIEVDKYPTILDQFDKVIVLHNEYVTITEFNAITQHPKVLYLHPNALYAEIDVDYENDTITLLRGHGYPDPQIGNGFNWMFDNSEFEYDDCQDNWNFNKIDNGMMLNCYPENIIYKNYTLLKMIKDY
ncbi:MAG: hypothetical protein ACREAU_06545 [Nitrosopumilaceae archaeon]